MTEPKADALHAQLAAGWCSASELAAQFGWQRHTLRGAISKLAKARNLKIERRRESGVNFYRVADGDVENGSSRSHSG
ncbi:DUF3489 domain-containing protein [Bradyrhizobium vignae]|uniref:Uncharacterized protein n=1 Tax=Bradyrhizobium vignae TaxID=1549949 RepID=A0A2U3PS86_9BRAD|nr:protein of unknown function [Bradyrhizobium vignae]